MLFGSSLLPGLIWIGSREVQLGEIVRRAFADSRLNVEDWNDLKPLTREILLARTIYEMRAEADKEQR